MYLLNIYVHSINYPKNYRSKQTSLLIWYHINFTPLTCVMKHILNIHVQIKYLLKARFNQASDV